MSLLAPCRAVAEEQRSLALGVQSVLWRTLGSIPGPILFGVIFDSSCVYWQYDCGRRGNCWVYNNEEISTRAFAITIIGVIINVVLMLLCWIFYPPITCKQPDEEEELKGIKNPTYLPESNDKGLAEMSSVEKSSPPDKDLFENPTFSESDGLGEKRPEKSSAAGLY